MQRMTSQQLLILLPMLALLVWAAAVDLRERRIPNWLTLGMIVAGLAQSLIFRGHLTIGQAWLGMLIGFALVFVPFAIGAMGGGDVKLMAGIGAWTGPIFVFQVFLAAAVVGLIIVLAQCVAQGRLAALFRNSAVLVMNFMHFSDVGAEHVKQTGQASRSIDRPLPYAVPVLIGCVLLLVLR
jgi:prepilin peptidase CpaA